MNLENAKKKAAFVEAFTGGIIRVMVATQHPAFVGPSALKVNPGCMLDLNRPRGAHDCGCDDDGIWETLSFDMKRTRVFVPWDAVAVIDAVVEDGVKYKRLYPRPDLDAEETRKKIRAAILAKSSGKIGIGFNPHDPAVVVPHGVIENNQGRTQTKLIFNNDFGDLHINAEGIQETLKFLGDGLGPDALVHCFVPWTAVSVVSEEDTRAIRYECEAPKWEAPAPSGKAKLEVVVTEPDEYTPTPPRKGHLRLIQGEKR